MWYMQNLLWNALGESSKQLWRMFGPQEFKPKRAAAHSVWRTQRFFPDMSLRLKATGAEVLTVSLELHQAASHLGTSMYVL